MSCMGKNTTKVCNIYGYIPETYWREELESNIDLLEVGEKMGLKKKKCMDIFSKISLVVCAFFSIYI